MDPTTRLRLHLSLVSSSNPSQAQVSHGRQNGSPFFRSSTMSRPHLLPEMLDRIIDFLWDSSVTLKSCSPVSKSWIPRTRKHLFVHIVFDTINDLESWEAMFSDPSTSPVCYTEELFIGSDYAIAFATSYEWVSAFPRAMHLTISIYNNEIGDSEVSFAPFHGFSLVLKSLRVDYAPSHPHRFSTSSPISSSRG